MLASGQTRRVRVRDATVLLLEDNALISIDIEDMLLEMGAKRVRAAYTLDTALDVLGQEAIDTAVLDMMIGPARSEDLARLLIERGIPIVFVSGYADLAGLPEDMRHVPMVRKPYCADGLAAALASAGVAMG